MKVESCHFESLPNFFDWAQKEIDRLPETTIPTKVGIPTIHTEIPTFVGMKSI